MRQANDGRITRRQRDVYRFLDETVRSRGVPPSIREVATHFRFSSPRSAEKHLAALQRKGLIRRHPGARNLELLAREPDTTHDIPILGRVPAGTPLIAVDDFAGLLRVREMFGDPENLFALRVVGNSMVKAGIFEGDWVVVRQQASVASGEIAVVYLGPASEATVKRVFFEREHVRLQPENDELTPAVIQRDDPDLRLAGKVVGVIRRL